MGRKKLSSKIRILQQDCDPSVANDKSLPNNSFLVEYKQGDTKCYDLIIANKAVDIFDYYWDEYKESFVGYKQSAGAINPKLWGSPIPNKKKK